MRCRTLGAVAALGSILVMSPAAAARAAGSGDAAGTRTVVALGDSYSSGEGAGRYDRGTDTWRDSCRRSPLAWPRLLDELSSGALRLSAHLACSGTGVTDLGRSIESEPSQLDRYRALPAPSIATVTLGGNELDFGSILVRCVLTDCSSSRLVTRNLAMVEDPGRHGLAWMLAAGLADVVRTHPGTRVVVVGYPNIFPRTDAAATECFWLNPRERADLVRIADAMDAAVRRAARLAGAEFVSVLDVLAGHEECTRSSFMNPIGYPISALADLSSDGHPRPAGQRAIAAAVASYLIRH